MNSERNGTLAIDFEDDLVVSEVRSPGRRPVVKLLGGFDLQDGPETIALSRSSQRLLAFLALQRRWVQRDYLAARLWPESSDEQANASLRSALWRLRQPGLELVDATHRLLRLRDDVEVDVALMEDLARRLAAPARQWAEVRIPHVEALTEELLPGWYEDWVLVERERIRQLFLRALEVVSERLMRQGRYAEAVEAALAAVRSEPLRESAHGLLVRVHLMEGNRSEALRQYWVFRQLLKAELGIPPSPEFEELLAAAT